MQRRQRSRNPNRSWSLTVTTIATSFRRSGQQDPSADDNSGYRREKKKCRNWLRTRRKAKLRWLPACPPSGRDMTPTPMAIQRTGSRSPQLRLPLYFSQQFFQGRPAEPGFLSCALQEKSPPSGDDLGMPAVLALLPGRPPDLILSNPSATNKTPRIFTACQH